MANNYKSFIQNQFEKAKSTASEFISSRSEEQEEDTVEIHPHYYVELKAMADMKQTTVQAIVNEIIVQHLSSTPTKSTPISVDQKEENPLLYLDGICKLKD
jgi:predicted choloylglycine hydrolase